MSDPQSEIWTVRRLLEWTREFLAKNAVDEPRLSAELLLAHVLGVQRLELILRRDYQPSPAERAAYRSLIRRRADHEPIEYLTGSKPFYKYEFVVTPEVLIPRPETELLVEAVLETLAPASQRFAAPVRSLSATASETRLADGLGSGARPAVNATGADIEVEPGEDGAPDFDDDEFAEEPNESDAADHRAQPSRTPMQSPLQEQSRVVRLPRTVKPPTVTSQAAVRVLDLCTGSGCVAVSLARELPAATILATDISEAALAVARRNAERLGVADRVKFYRGDLYEALPADTAPVDFLVANPPYIPTEVVAKLDRTVREYEPHLALDGGADGLAIVRRLVMGAPRWLKPGGQLWVEIGHDQGLSAPELLGAVPGFTEILVRRDLARQPRVLTGRYMPKC